MAINQVTLFGNSCIEIFHIYYENCCLFILISFTLILTHSSTLEININNPLLDVTQEVILIVESAGRSWFMFQISSPDL